MTNSLKVPTNIPSWVKNPKGYLRHQALLQQLVDHLISLNIPVELPEEVPGRPHDAGTDLLVGANKVAIDLKSFWLRKSPKSYTWDSPVHSFSEGRKAFYSGRETKFYIHAKAGVPVDQWLVGTASGLRKSYYEKQAPFYFKNDVQSVHRFIYSLRTPF